VGNGTVRRCAAVLAVLLSAIAPAATAGPDPTGTPAVTEQDPDLPEPLSPEQRASVLAEPAIVSIEVRWQGYVRDRTTGEILDPEPVSASTRCTGAGVGSEGYLLTTASCLRPTAVALDAFGQLVQRRVADGRTPADQAEDLLAQLLRDAVIGWPLEEDPVERTVLVRRAVTTDDPMPATVVAMADPDAGDAALLKIARSRQPVLPFAEGVQVGDRLVIVACPSTDASGESGGAVTPTPAPGGDGAVKPQFRGGVVRETEPHVVVDPVVPGEGPATLPGGVVLTEDAAFVGLVDASLGGRDVLVDAPVVRELLADAEVDTELGQVDRDFRAGVDAYYAGQYTESIERFDAVLAIIPSHLQAHEYRDDAQTRRGAQGGDEPAPPSLWVRFERFGNTYSGAIVGLVVLVAIMVFLVHRRRPVQLPTEGDADPRRPAEAPVGSEPDQTKT